MRTGNRVRLADFRGKSSVVLMFYPADNTPGCTKQLCTARDDYDKYVGRRASPCSASTPAAPTRTRSSPRNTASRRRCSSTHGGKVSRAYDALMPVPLVTLVNRTVVGIDREGVVRFYERGMPPTSEIIGALSAGAAV